MKRLLLILFCLLIYPFTPCQAAENVQVARMSLPVMAGSGAAPACATPTELISQGNTSSNTSLLTYCIGAKITVAPNTYITEMLPYVSFYGGAANMTCSLYTEVDSKPGAEISGTSVTNAIGTDTGYKSMVINPAVLLTGTTYYVVCKSLGATAAIWTRADSGGASSGATNTSGSCGTFNANNSQLQTMKINGCAP
jgi:hypothetical protein